MMIPRPVDPTSGVEIDWSARPRFDMGHQPGYEFQSHQLYAQWGQRAWWGRLGRAGRDRAIWRTENLEPSHYMPQDASANRGHGFDLVFPRLGFGLYLGP